MSDFETSLVVVMTLAVGGMAIVGFVGWIVQDAVKAEAKALHERADRLDGKTDEQSSTLASVSAELHGARTDLTALRGEVDMLAHGPPSMRSPQGPRGKAS
jgi:hypothetical protein